MSTIRFIGHTGEITALSRLHPNTMFVFDANTVLALLRHADQGTRLDEPHFRLLQETRRRVHLQWVQRSKRIPVEPVLALMELARQDHELDFPAYLSKFQHFFRSVYGVRNLDPAWVQATYKPVSRLLDSVHHSLRQTLEQIQIAAPATGILDREAILTRIDRFLAWVIAERENLSVIGGPLLYLAVYAIAGSPNAHRFLKIQRIAKDGHDSVARNVAWDLMHWVNLDFQYHYAKYPSTVVCTSDQALADFLLIRQNLAARTGRAGMLGTNIVNSYGRINLPKLSRLDDTALGEEIGKRLLIFWQWLGQKPGDEIWFRPGEE